MIRRLSNVLYIFCIFLAIIVACFGIILSGLPTKIYGQCCATRTYEITIGSGQKVMAVSSHSETIVTSSDGTTFSFPAHVGAQGIGRALDNFFESHKNASSTFQARPADTIILPVLDGPWNEYQEKLKPDGLETVNFDSMILIVITIIISLAIFICGYSLRYILTGSKSLLIG